MNDTNIGSNGSQRNNIVDPSTVIPYLVVPQPHQSYHDSIGASDQESAPSTVNANSPRLPLPMEGAFILSMQNQMASISLDALKAWGKSIEEQAAIIKEEINSPRYLDLQAEKTRVSSSTSNSPVDSSTEANQKIAPNEVALSQRQEWTESLGALVNVAIQLAEGASINGTVSPAVVAATAPGTAAISGENADAGSQNIASKIITQGAALAAAEVIFFQAPITSVALKSGLHNEFQVFNEAWSGLTSYSVDPATQKAGWFSAMWGIGLIYQLSTQKLGSYGLAKNGDKPARDIDFAKNYALQALNTIQTPAFNMAIQAMLIASPEKSAQTGSSNAHLETLMAKAKLVILSLALGLLAKLEVGSHKDEGWINELEFKGLINGETDITKNDIFETAGIKKHLITQINVLLAELAPAEKDDVMYRLSSYMSSNPAIEEMLDQQTAFETVFSPPSLGEKRILESPS